MITTFPVYLIDREKVSLIPDFPNEYQLASIEDLEGDGMKDLLQGDGMKDLLQGDRLQLLEGIFTVNYQTIANGKKEMYLTPSGG